MRCKTTTANLKVMSGKKHNSNSNLKPTQGEQDGGGVGGRSTSLSTDTPGMHLQTQKCMQNTS